MANELGVLAYRNQQYEAAAAWLRRALSLVPGGLNASEWAGAGWRGGDSHREMVQWGHPPEQTRCCWVAKDA